MKKRVTVSVTAFLLSVLLLSSCTVRKIPTGTDAPTEPVTEPPATTAAPETETLPPETETLPAETEPPETEPAETEPPETEPPAPVKTVPIGFYRKNAEKTQRDRITEYVSDWTVKQDIFLLPVFLSDEESLPASPVATVWQDCIAKWQDARPVKLGFVITFTFWESGETHSVIVTKPGDWGKYEEFLEVYLYDDVANAGKGWYSHITAEEFNETTTINEIKLTPGKRVDALSSTVRVTVFAYEDESEFDRETGEYFGANCATLTVRNTAYPAHPEDTSGENAVQTEP